MILHFHCAFHLGDCVYHALYMRRLLFESPELHITFYCPAEYHPEILAMLAPHRDRFVVEPLTLKPETSIDAWIGAEGYIFRSPIASDYNRFYVDWFHHLSAKAGVPCPIRSDRDMLFPVDGEPPPMEYDCLVLNAPLQSGQFEFLEQEWDDLITRLIASGYRCATTHPNRSNAFSTLAHGLRLVDLARFSAGCRRIIGINTAPMVPCFNTANIERCGAWYVCDKFHHYTYNDRIHRCMSFPQLLARLRADAVIS